MSRPIEDALQACLDAIEQGQTAAELLARWPDPAERDALAPLLAEAAALGGPPPMDPGRRGDLAAELALVGQTLYPPPPAAGLLARIPPGPAILLSLLGAGLVAWWLLAGRGAPAAGDPAAGNPTVPARSVPASAAGLGSADVPASPGGAAAASPDSAAGPAGLPPGAGAGAANDPRSPQETREARQVERAEEGGAAPESPSRADARGPASATPLAVPTHASPPAADPVVEGGGGATPPTAPVHAGGEAPGGSSASNSPTAVLLTGRVMDAEGRGIAGALVNAYPLGGPGFYLQRTGADGGYRLRLRPGSYSFHAAAEGFAGQWHAGAAQRAEATVVDVAADRPPAGIDFYLEAGHNGGGDSASDVARPTGRPTQGGP